MPRIIRWSLLSAVFVASTLMAANFGLSPSKLEFGGVKVGANKSMTFKINPQSAMDFEVTSNNTAFVVVGDKSFRAGKETTITIRFVPGAAGAQEGKIMITAPGDGITKTVTVNGGGE